MAMLGSQCSSCCGVCGCKTPNKLPYTMTVTFDGLKNKTHGNYCDLTIASDIGSGAAGVATAPGGCDGENDPLCCTYAKNSAGKCDSTETCDSSDRGPLTGVLLTEPGEGYLVYRSEPTLEASGGSGTGADFTVTLKNKTCAWSVDSIAVTGGENYKDDDALTITQSEDDTVITKATAKLHTTRAQPNLTASADGGTGADFGISYTKNSGPPVTYSVSAITVKSGGSGYTDGSAVTLTATAPDVAVSGATATIATNRIAPTLSAAVYSYSGSGASLSVSVSPSGDGWAASSVSVTNGGANYYPWEYVDISVSDGQGSGAYAYVTDVDEGGAITAVSVYGGGYYWKDGGVVQSVSVANGGSYYKDTGVPTTVEVTNAGKYYRLDPDAEPCAPITVTACGGGTGAEISAKVDLDKKSSTFGQITGLTIDDGGDDYLAWNWIKTCREKLNGIPFVLRANTPETLVTLSFQSCYGEGAKALVVPLGVRTQPDVCIIGSGTDGTITPTLSKAGEEDDNEWLPYWSIESVSASGGYGYTNDEQGLIDYRGATVPESAEVTLQATGVTEEDPPNAKNDGVLTGATVVKAGKFYLQHDYDGMPGPIKLVQLVSGGSKYARLGREQPSLTITGNGSGATFSPTFKAKQDGCKLDYWQVESLSIGGGGGSDYTDASPLTISLATSNDKSDAAAAATVYTREEPTVDAEAQSKVGSGATFSVTLTKGESLPRTWAVSSISVSSGGSKYPASVPLSFTVAGDGTKISDAAATATANEDGVIESVSVSSGGAYYLDNGTAIETKVTAGGQYYRENKALAPYVADVTVVVSQQLPSDGDGAAITATVESNTGSNKFGQIKKLTITDGGSGYEILGGPLDCKYTGLCDFAVQFRGKGKPAEITLDDAVFRTDDVLDDCANLPSSASVFHSIGEGSVTLTPGGSWNGDVVVPCCNDCTPTDSEACNQETPDEPPCGGAPGCPGCTGYCDECNKCASGCGCRGGECAPCCGPCDEENPCPDGCECVGGKCSDPCDCDYSGYAAVLQDKSICDGPCVSDPYAMFSTLTVSGGTPGMYGLFFSSPPQKKATAGNHECEPVLFAFFNVRSFLGFSVGCPCHVTITLKMMVPVCHNGTYEDVTDDYEEPDEANFIYEQPCTLYALARVGPWKYSGDLGPDPPQIVEVCQVIDKCDDEAPINCEGCNPLP